MPTNKQKVSFIVSKEILSKEGQFTSKDIINKIKDKILNYFKSEEELEKYVVKKMDSMCIDGLISRTDTYYFFYKEELVK